MSKEQTYAVQVSFVMQNLHYFVMTSELKKLVMAKFCSAITLTSLKFQKCMCRKEHVNIDVSRTD